MRIILLQRYALRSNKLKWMIMNRLYTIHESDNIGLPGGESARLKIQSVQL